MPGLPSRFGSSTRTRNQGSPQSLHSHDTSWGFDSQASRHCSRYNGESIRGMNEKRRNSTLSRKSYVTKDKRPAVTQMQNQPGAERKREFQDVHLCERLRLDLLHSLRDREVLKDEVPNRLPYSKKQIAHNDCDTTTSDTDADGIDQTRPATSRRRHKHEEERVGLHSLMYSDSGLTEAVANPKRSSDNKASWKEADIYFGSPRSTGREIDKKHIDYQKSSLNEVSYFVPKQLDSSSILNSFTMVEKSKRSELSNTSDSYNLTEIILHYEAESHAAMGRPSKSSRVQHLSYPTLGPSTTGIREPRNSTPILSSRQTFQTNRLVPKKDKRRSSSYVQNEQKKLRDQQYWYQKIREYRSLLEMDISKELRLYVEQCYFFAVEQLVSLWGEAHVPHSRQYHDTRGQQGGESTKRVSFKGEVSFEPGYNAHEHEPPFGHQRAMRRQGQRYSTMQSSLEDSYSDCSSRDHINEKNMEFSPSRYVSCPERNHKGTTPYDFPLGEVNHPNEQFPFSVRLEHLTELLGLNNNYSYFHGASPVVNGALNGAQRECTLEPKAVRGDPCLSDRPLECNHQNTSEPAKRISVEKERLTFLAQLAQLEQNLRESKRDVKKQLLSEPSPRKRKILEDHYIDICDDLSSVERRMKEIIRSLGLDELKVRNIIEYQLDEAEETRKEGIDFFMGLVEGEALEEDFGGFSPDQEQESGIGSANQSMEMGLMHDDQCSRQFESRPRELVVPSLPRNGGSVERSRAGGDEDASLRQEVQDLREKLSALERSVGEGTEKQVNAEVDKKSQTSSPSEAGKESKESRIQSDTWTSQQNFARLNRREELIGDDWMPSSPDEANDSFGGVNFPRVCTDGSERRLVLDDPGRLKGFKEGVDNSGHQKDHDPGIGDKDGNNNVSNGNFAFGSGNDEVHKMHECVDNKVMNQSSKDSEQSLNSSAETAPLKRHLNHLREQRLRYFDNKQAEIRERVICDKGQPSAKPNENKPDTSDSCPSNDGLNVLSPQKEKNSVEKKKVEGNFSNVEDSLNDGVICFRNEKMNKPSFELEVKNQKDSKSNLAHALDEEESENEPLLEDYRQALEEKDRETGSELEESWNGIPDARKLQQTSEKQIETPNLLNDLFQSDSLDCEQPDILSLASTEHVSFDESITDLLSMEELELLDTLDRLTPEDYSIVPADKIVNDSLMEQSQKPDSARECDGYAVREMGHENLLDSSESHGRSYYSELPNASSKGIEHKLTFDDGFAPHKYVRDSALNFATEDELVSSDESYTALRSDGGDFDKHRPDKDYEIPENRGMDSDIEVEDTDQLSWLEEDIVTVIDADGSDRISHLSSDQSFEGKLPSDKSEIILRSESDLIGNKPSKEGVNSDEYTRKEINVSGEESSDYLRDRDDFLDSVESLLEEELTNHNNSVDKSGAFALNEAAEPSADNYQCAKNRPYSPDHMKSSDAQLNIITDVAGQNEVDSDEAPMELTCEVARDSCSVSSPSVDFGILESYVDLEKEFDRIVDSGDHKENGGNDAISSDHDIHEKEKLFSEIRDYQKDHILHTYTSQGDKETHKNTNFEGEVERTTAATVEQEEVKSKRDKLLSPYLLEQCSDENLTTEDNFTFGDMSDGYARSLSLTSLEEYLSDVDTDALNSSYPESVGRHLDQQELIGFPVKDAGSAKLSTAVLIDEAILESEKDFSLKSFGDEPKSTTEGSDTDFIESLDSSGEPDVHLDVVKEDFICGERSVDQALADFRFVSDGEKGSHTAEPTCGHSDEGKLENQSQPVEGNSAKDAEAFAVRQMWVFRQVKLQPEAFTDSDSQTVHDSDTDVLSIATGKSAEEDLLGSFHRSAVNCDPNGVGEEALATSEQTSKIEKTDQLRENQTAERIVISDDRLYTISEVSVEEFDPSLDLSSLHSEIFEGEDDALIDEESIGMEWEDVSLSLSSRAEPTEDEGGSLSNRSLPVTGEENHHFSKLAVPAKTENGISPLSKDPVPAITEGENLSLSNDVVLAITEGENLSLSNDAVPGITENENLSLSNDAVLAITEDKNLSLSDDAIPAITENENLSLSNNAVLALTENENLSLSDDAVPATIEDQNLLLTNNAVAGITENENLSLANDAVPALTEDEDLFLSKDAVVAITEDENLSLSNDAVPAITEEEDLFLSNDAVPAITEDDSKYRDAATDAEDIKKWLTMLIREEAEARRTLEPIDIEEIQEILQRAQSGMSNHTDTDSTSSHSDSANLVTFEYIRRLWASRKSLRKLNGEEDDGSNLVTLDYLRKLFSSQRQGSEMFTKDKEPNITRKPDDEREADLSFSEESTSVSERDGDDVESLQSFQVECDVMNGEIEQSDQVQQEIEGIDEIDAVDETVKGASLGATLSLISQSSMDFGCPIVMDNGSGMMKAGLATEDFPSIVSPNVVGRPNYKEVMVDDSHKDYYVGSEAERYRGILKLAYPIEHGIVTDWKDMERIWEHVLTDELRVEPEEHPVLMTEAPFNPKRNRERMLEIMMEVFRVPAFYVAIQAVLALYSSGRTTGIVLDSGDGVTHIVPVADGYSLPHASERTNIAGRDITQYLMKILMESGYTMKTSAEQDICRRMKEDLCYVAMDYERALKDAESFSDNFELFTLPDGQIIRLSDERFRATEILFRPHLIGQDLNGIHEDLNKSIHKCDIDIRSDLYRNIVLSGGTTMLPGLDKRLLRELSLLRDNKDGSAIKVVASADRRFSVWAGGAALAILPTFRDMWISSDDYFEHGVNLVHAKCF